jgi:hypothetical protein
MLLFTACTTTKKAVDHLVNTGELAGICAAYYPAKDSAGVPQIQYRPGDNIDLTHQLDSLVAVATAAARRADSLAIQLPDTGVCCAEVRTYPPVIASLRSEIARLRGAYHPCLPDTIRITMRHYTRDRAQEEVLKQRGDKAVAETERYKNKFSWWQKAGIIGWAIILCVVLGLIISIIIKLKKPW